MGGRNHSRGGRSRGRDKGRGDMNHSGGGWGRGDQGNSRTCPGYSWGSRSCSVSSGKGAWCCGCNTMVL